MMTQTHSNRRSRKTPPASAPAIIGVLFMVLPTLLPESPLPGLVGLGSGGRILVLAVALVVLAMGELVSAMKFVLLMVGLEVEALSPPEPLPLPLPSLAFKGADIPSIIISATVPLPFQRLLAPTSITHGPYIARVIQYRPAPVL